MPRVCRSCCGTNTTFAGVVRGHSNIGIPATAMGAITITRISDGMVLWTGSSDANGNFSGTISLAATASVLLAATPDTTRFTSFSATRTLTAGGTNPGFDVGRNSSGVNDVAGFHAIGSITTPICGVPIPDTIYRRANGGPPIAFNYGLIIATNYWFATPNTLGQLRQSDAMYNPTGTFVSPTASACPPTFSLTYVIGGNTFVFTET